MLDISSVSTHKFVGRVDVEQPITDKTREFNMS
jgi:hypothetical protein